jgi:hypothetical protein
MSKTVTVDVNGDRGLEWEEVSCGNLPDASGAFATSGQGTGLGRNDDREGIGLRCGVDRY